MARNETYFVLLLLFSVVKILVGKSIHKSTMLIENNVIKNILPMPI